MKIKKFDEITVAELQSFGGVIVDGDSQKVYCRESRQSLGSGTALRGLHSPSPVSSPCTIGLTQKKREVKKNEQCR